MHDYLLSLIRTAVPAAVGLVVACLARALGRVLPEDLSAELTLVVAGLAIGAYYAAVLALELRWPWVGRLLGSRRQPAYVRPGEAAEWPVRPPRLIRGLAGPSGLPLAPPGTWPGADHRSRGRRAPRSPTQGGGALVVGWGQADGSAARSRRNSRHCLR